MRRIPPELLQSREKVPRFDIVQTVADKQQHSPQRIAPKAQIQRRVKLHALKIAALREHQRIVVLKIVVTFDDLRRSFRSHR